MISEATLTWNHAWVEGNSGKHGPGSARLLNFAMFIILFRDMYMYAYVAYTCDIYVCIYIYSVMYRHTSFYGALLYYTS